MNIPFIIATSDSTSHILTAYDWLMQKYAPEIVKITVLGYADNPVLSDRYEIIQLADKQITIDNWCSCIHSYTKNITDEFIIFGLDDFLPVKSFDYSVFNEVMNVMKQDDSIVRYELGVGHQWHNSKNIVKDFGDWNIYEYAPDSLYKISTQFSVWRTEYFNFVMDHYWNPWQFEVEGSKNADNYNVKIIATDKKCAWGWVWSGAISGRHPNMVNIAGLNRDDIEELISLGIFEKDKLQYGMEIGQNKRYE